MHIIKKVILIGVLLLLAASASGEYYQYTDEGGNIRFTDDISLVPEAQRQAMKTYRSAKSVPDKTAATVPSDDKKMEPAEPSDIGKLDSGIVKKQPEPSKALPDEGAGTKTMEETSPASAAKLDKMQAELNKTRESLNKERAELEAHIPQKNATSEERIAYSVKVDALNARIDQFEKDLESFNEKVAAFNKQNHKKGLN